MNLFDALSVGLEDPRWTEREVHALLKSHPDFITGMFADSWNYAETFSEVWFGSDYRLDFLTLCANSGYWIAHAVELKSPSAELYIKSGSKSKALQLVERQLAERENWRRENEQAFRQVLAKLVSEDSAAQCSNASVHTRARSELLDPRTVVHLHCHAVVGRSSNMSDQERATRRLDEQKRGEWGSPAVLTYDRILSKAKRLHESGVA
jgi:hypothetical protein